MTKHFTYCIYCKLKNYFLRISWNEGKHKLNAVSLGKYQCTAYIILVYARARVQLGA